MNKVKEILNLLAEWQTKWWWRVLRIIVILTMVTITVWVILDYCNYTDEDKTAILQYLAISLLAVIVMYFFWRRGVEEEYFEWLLVIVIMTVIAVLAAWDAYYCKCLIGKDKPITLEYLLGSLGAIFTMYLVWRRTKSQEEQIKNQTQQISNQEEGIKIQTQQIKNQEEQVKNQTRQISSQEEQVKIQARRLDREIGKEIDDRFTTAVNLLGSSETSARTGAIYSLYQQAVEHKKYRKQIVQILCSHIRSKTQEPKYQEQHKDRPSNEIQTTIDLLFRETENKGLYPQFREYFPDEKLSTDYLEQTLPNANLSRAYCVGADFREAHCQGANFEEAHCQGANFLQADCRGANFLQADCRGANFGGAHCQEAEFTNASCQRASFMRADCQGTNFWRARCQGADFEKSHCQGSNFGGAYCQGTNFMYADCQGASFNEAHCQGADFEETHCQGAHFMEARCQGADFEKSHCQGTNFMYAHCQGTNFMYADCQGASFNEAHCQGADFEETHCQGAYSSDQLQSLQSRIGEDTELELVLEGALSKEYIDAIETAAEHCSSAWHPKMQKIIEANKDKKEKFVTHDNIDGIISGVLEDSEELRKLIKELKEIKERNII